MCRYSNTEVRYHCSECSTILLYYDSRHSKALQDVGFPEYVLHAELHSGLLDRLMTSSFQATIGRSCVGLHDQIIQLLVRE